MKSIVALVDFSDVSSSVLKQVQTLAQAFKSHVTVLHGMPASHAVVDLGVASPAIAQPPTPEAIQADLARLEKVTEPLRAAGVDVTLKQFHNTTVENIIKEALRIAADVIIVGSHRHNSIYNLIVGSVTHDLLMRAKCPVLVVST